MSQSAWWLIFGVNLLGFKSSRSICTALDISVRVFLERSNWGYKAQPESEWYHTMDWGSERIKGGKGKCYPSISSFFCFLVHHGVNFVLQHSPTMTTDVQLRAQTLLLTLHCSCQPPCHSDREVPNMIFSLIAFHLKWAPGKDYFRIPEWTTCPQQFLPESFQEPTVFR